MDEPPRIPSTWLNRIQFPLGNPFSTREHAGDDALLDYFIQPVGFEEFRGSAYALRSGIMTAKKGCGKTTFRQVVEQQCRAAHLDAPVLAIAYTEFSRVLRRGDEDGIVASEHHTRAIIRVGARVLFDALADEPDKTAAFVGGARHRLAHYLAHYTNLFSQEAGLDDWLGDRKLLSERTHLAALRRGEGAQTPFLRFVSQLLSIEPGSPDTTKTAVEIMSDFVRLARDAGFEAVYVLIDRVDEREPMASDPSRAATLLWDLVSNLPLMELPYVAFKFFITPEVLSELRRPGFRPDRLLIREITWTKDELRRLLDRRVQIFSHNAIQSLDAVTATGTFTSRMAAAADGSPRNMLLIGDWLLYYFHHRVGMDGSFPIEVQDLERALVSFARLRMPSEEAPSIVAEQKPESGPPGKRPPRRATPAGRVRIDERDVIWVGDRRVGDLTPLLKKLLKHLLEHSGVCSYDALGEAAYGPDFMISETEYGSIDRAIQRLRHDLGLGEAGRRIIQKVREPNGYRMNQPDE